MIVLWVKTLRHHDGYKYGSKLSQTEMKYVSMVLLRLLVKYYS